MKCELKWRRDSWPQYWTVEIIINGIGYGSMLISHRAESFSKVMDAVKLAEKEGRFSHY